MLDAVLAASAVTPSLLLLVYFQTRDLFPEPRRLIWLTFGWGILTVIPVICVGFPLMSVVHQIDSPVGQALAHAFGVAAIPEELCKFLVLYFFCFRQHAFDEPMDGVVYGVTTSLGFATLENILYVVGGGFPVALSRALTALPCHALLGVVMGYYVGQIHSHPSNARAYKIKALAWPILMHGLYDFPLLLARITHQNTGEVKGAALSLLSLIPLVLGALFIAAVLILRRLGRAQEKLHPEISPPTFLGELPTLLGAILASASGALILGLLVAIYKSLGEQPAIDSESARFWMANGIAACVVGPLGGWIFWRSIRRTNQ